MHSSNFNFYADVLYERLELNVQNMPYKCKKKKNIYSPFFNVEKSAFFIVMKSGPLGIKIVSGFFLYALLYESFSCMLFHIFAKSCESFEGLMCIFLYLK